MSIDAKKTKQSGAAREEAAAAGRAEEEAVDEEEDDEEKEAREMEEAREMGGEREEEEAIEKEESREEKGAPLATVALGGQVICAHGLGTLALAVRYPDQSKRPSRAAAIALIHAALDAGAGIIDTGDTYCDGADDHHSGERVVGRGVHPSTFRLNVSTFRWIRWVLDSPPVY